MVVTFPVYIEYIAHDYWAGRIIFTTALVLLANELTNSMYL